MAKGSTGTVEPTAVLGGFITAVICVSAALLAGLGVRELFDWSNSGTGALISLLSIVGFLLGGFRAGLLCPPAPLTNGAVSALVAYVPLAIIQRLVADKPFRPLSLIFGASFAAMVGVFGGYVSNNANRARVARATRAAQEEDRRSSTASGDSD